uniref:Uncharacterized protein n=1 Tax=Anguilla anguilla TaxID=7936 RepID=A0A0E9WA26_ANGAN
MNTYLWALANDINAVFTSQHCKVCYHVSCYNKHITNNKITNAAVKSRLFTCTKRTQARKLAPFLFLLGK